MTPDELHEATGCTVENAEKWAGPITAAMEEFEVNTPERQAAFIAQIAHETGRFKWIREIWGPTQAQLRYEGRADLGNIHPGDGKRYMGRGLIQLTGRNNYRSASARFGVDFETDPDLVCAPEWAARIAGDFWKSRSLNELADEGAFERITRKINGGLNGYTDRVVLYDKAMRALDVA